MKQYVQNRIEPVSTCLIFSACLLPSQEMIQQYGTYKRPTLLCSTSQQDQMVILQCGAFLPQEMHNNQNFLLVLKHNATVGEYIQNLMTISD